MTFEGDKQGGKIQTQAALMSIEPSVIGSEFYEVCAEQSWQIVLYPLGDAMPMLHYPLEGKDCVSRL